MNAWLYIIFDKVNSCFIRWWKSVSCCFVAMLSDLFLYSGVHEYCRVTIASLEQKCSVQIKKWPGPATALVSAGIKLIHLSTLYKILQNQNGNNCIVLKGSYLDCRRQGCPEDFGGPVRIPWPRSRALKPGLIRFFFHPEQCFLSQIPPAFL